MDTKWLSDKLNYDAPLVLGGCRCTKTSFECCEYNVVVFDSKRTQDETVIDGRTVLVHHDSIDTPSSGIFTHIPQMHVISDESWSIAPKISAIIKKRDEIFRHATKSALVDAKILTHTAKKMLDDAPTSAPFWTKSAAYRLADAILHYNMIEPCGSHIMAQLRALPHSTPNAALSTVYECLGVERATPSLLERMTKSLVGFLNLGDAGKLASKAIADKVHHLESSLLYADSYYYIGHTACAALYSQYRHTFVIPDTELYVLKIALDPDRNAQHTLTHIRLLERTITELMRHTKWSAPDTQT